MAEVCPVCPRHCALENGQRGVCRARVNAGGEMIAENYGRVTSLALDPIEKKPFARFHPGSSILSVGSYGCNLRCAFCQNNGISQTGPQGVEWREVSPAALVAQALELRHHRNIGIAFTYNEPSVGWEYVRDAAELAVEQGLLCAMVTNGCFCPDVLEALLPTVDAFNIDLKCFTEEGYKELGGDFETVKHTIRRASEEAHVEVTTLVVPGFSDGEEEMDAEATWLAGIDPDIPLHLSRYFPCYHMEKPATARGRLEKLYDIAKKYLRHVYLGNV